MNYVYDFDTNYITTISMNYGYDKLAKNIDPDLSLSDPILT